MKKSNTPRTDEAAWHTGLIDRTFVHSSFARKLELETVELQAQNNDLEELCFRWMKTANDLVAAITIYKSEDSIKEAVNAYHFLAKGRQWERRLNI